jgi:hypothetical protein
MARRDGRVAEGARLESVYTLTGIGGSNPSLSARSHVPAFYLHELFMSHASYSAARLEALFYLKLRSHRNC